MLTSPIKYYIINKKTCFNIGGIKIKNKLKQFLQLGACLLLLFSFTAYAKSDNQNQETGSSADNQTNSDSDSHGTANVTIDDALTKVIGLNEDQIATYFGDKYDSEYWCVTLDDFLGFRYDTWKAQQKSSGDLGCLKPELFYDYPDYNGYVTFPEGNGTVTNASLSGEWDYFGSGDADSIRNAFVEYMETEYNTKPAFKDYDNYYFILPECIITLNYSNTSSLEITYDNYCDTMHEMSDSIFRIISERSDINGDIVDSTAAKQAVTDIIQENYSQFNTEIDTSDNIEFYNDLIAYILSRPDSTLSLKNVNLKHMTDYTDEVQQTVYLEYFGLSSESIGRPYAGPNTVVKKLK